MAAGMHEVYFTAAKRCTLCLCKVTFLEPIRPQMNVYLPAVYQVPAFYLTADIALI